MSCLPSFSSQSKQDEYPATPSIYFRNPPSSSDAPPFWKCTDPFIPFVINSNHHETGIYISPLRTLGSSYLIAIMVNCYPLIAIKKMYSCINSSTQPPSLMVVYVLQCIHWTSQTNNELLLPSCCLMSVNGSIDAVQQVHLFGWV